MGVTFDPPRRVETLKRRGFDLDHAGMVLEGVTVEREVRRLEGGEQRVVSVGMLRGEVVVVVWTNRGSVPHVCSMRKATTDETARYFRRVG